MLQNKYQIFQDLNVEMQIIKLFLENNHTIPYFYPTAYRQKMVKEITTIAYTL